MKAEEWKAWAMGLKPGDKVVLMSWGDPEAVLTVKRLTPSGRVVTDKGTYFQGAWSNRYIGYGDARGEIVPASPELIAEAEENQRKKEEARQREDTIMMARCMAYDLWNRRIEMSYELAKKIIALVQAETEANNDT